MIIDNLWTANGPSKRDLSVLERLEQRRIPIEAFEPDNEGLATLRTSLLSTLDFMEECLCQQGHNAPALDEGWRTLELFEPRLFGKRHCPRSQTSPPILRLKTSAPTSPNAEDPAMAKLAA